MLCWCVKNSKSDEPYTSVHLKPFIIIEDSTFSHAPETMSISYCLFKGFTLLNFFDRFSNCSNWYFIKRFSENCT